MPSKAQALLFDLGAVLVDIDFDRIFASHEIGLRKPEKRAFEHIATVIGVRVGSILFFDDLLENIEGARAAGLEAVQVRGPADVRDALRREGMIPA